MFGILLSALSSIVGFIFKSVIIKFVVFFALFFVVTEFLTVLRSWGGIPQIDTISRNLPAIPAAVWYFLEMMQFPLGLKIAVAAFAARFLIRRIPLIG